MVNEFLILGEGNDFFSLIFVNNYTYIHIHPQLRMMYALSKHMLPAILFRAFGFLAPNDV